MKNEYLFLAVKVFKVFLIFLFPVLALHSRMIVSLAFAPQENLIEALTVLEKFLPFELEPIFLFHKYLCW